ncbi:MAG: GDP-mannose 4,6-dehydratase [Patescibacteria group bacterium]|nr:GDP-mannose 4,6-dehydratase [Patescibacteria group bacterium]
MEKENKKISNGVKKALITGITGQDGSYLAELLLAKSYRVFGLERRSSTKNRTNIEKIEKNINFISGDLTDQHSLTRAIASAEPDEVYNLAAQSFVKESWEQPEYTGDVTGLGALRVLEAIRQVNPKIKYYQASSSEMFGRVQETPQSEKTPFYPRSPYGVAKLYAHWITVNYRESYNIFTCSGILFNHESERRGLEFVTRKITNAAAKIKLGLENKLYLGNLDAKRDWGYAPEYAEAMWMMLQREEPEDFVIATGEAHSVKDFVEAAFAVVDLDWKKYVEIDDCFKRPAEVYSLVGDASKAKTKLGWRPKVNFSELVKIMVEADLKKLKK